MKWTTWHLHSNNGWTENEYICNMLSQLSDIYQNNPEYYQRALLSVLTEIKTVKKYNGNIYNIFLTLLKTAKYGKIIKRNY